MRARIGIVVMIGGIVAFIAISMYVDAVKARAGTNSFERYYEPCEPDIRLNFTDYALPLDINDIVNLTETGRVVDVNAMSGLISQNGFAVTQFYSMFGDFLAVDFVDVYKSLKYREFPSFFITADTGLYLYRSVFDQTLCLIEECLFEPSIKDMTEALLEDALKKYNRLHGDLQEAAKRNVAYISVAQKLIDPNATIPDFVEPEVNGELAKIEAHQGVGQSDIFLYAEDYSQYVPRGHYARSDELKRYFKTMMWYGRMAFLLKGGPEGLVSEQDAKIQTMQACILADSLRNIQVEGRAGLNVWDEIYSITSFFVGLADDLTPMDYLSVIEKVFGNWFSLSELADEEKLFELKKELALLPSPEIYGGTGDIIVEGSIKNIDDVLDKTKGMRFMGRRFVPDSYVFQHLTFPEVDGYTGDPNKKPFTKDNTFDNRSYIRGLDFMAVLGSSEAMNILIEEGDTDFNNYDLRFNELKEEFDLLSLEERNQNLYWSWLYCLGGLLEELPEGYPNFMRTQNWQKSRLNASLASWTQLRYDTILYGKPNYAPPPFMPRIPPGYVEPNPVFWGRLLALTRMTRRGLENFDFRTNDLLEDSIVRRVENLEQFLQQVLDIVTKQLTNEPLSKEEEKFFKDLPDTLKELAKDGHRSSPTRATLIADVHTFSLEGLVVEEAVGFVDLIVVACPLADGKAFLAAGPVFSYYEFKHPMKDRLTDEAWEKMLSSPEKPERPKWYQPLMRQKDKSSSD